MSTLYSLLFLMFECITILYRHTWPYEVYFQRATEIARHSATESIQTSFS
jgi:hypothetical protein